MSYLVHSDDDRKKMLGCIGAKDVKELFKSIPGQIIYPKIDLNNPLSEKEIADKIETIASKNKTLNKFSSFLGGGAYNHYIPGVVKYVQSLSQFYTSYTPYQAEISQGTLQYIFEFQSLVCRLTGMGIANASMYDGASALAEAVLMAKRISGKNKALVSKTVHPEYRQTCSTYCKGTGIEIVELNYSGGKLDLDSLAGKIDDSTGSVVIQNPNFFGCFEDVYKIKEIISKFPDCKFIVAVNPNTLALLKPPSDYGADIVVGDGQVFGSSLSLGGPYLGFFATKEQFLRNMPGRIVSKTIDAKNNSAYVLTFQTREQHIRKYKATSNICSNHSLNALAATVYLSLVGEDGLREIANICLQRAHYLCDKIIAAGKFKLKFNTKFFNEFVISTDIDIKELLIKLRKENILGGIYLGTYFPELKDSMLVSVTEMNSMEDVDKYVEVLKKI
jgi:glycine dehydrogenase subunit 1